MSLPEIGKVHRAKGKTLNKSTVLTVFMEGKEGHRPQLTRREDRYKDKQVPAEHPHETTSTPA
jgi:hypothetical protein